MSQARCIQVDDIAPQASQVCEHPGLASGSSLPATLDSPCLTALPFCVQLYVHPPSYSPPTLLQDRVGVTQPVSGS